MTAKTRAREATIQAMTPPGGQWRNAQVFDGRKMLPLDVLSLSPNSWTSLCDAKTSVSYNEPRRGAGNLAIRAVLKTAGPRGPCGFESHPLRQNALLLQKG